MLVTISWVADTALGSDLPKFPFAREHGVEPSLLNAELRHKCPISQIRLFDGTKAYIIMKHKDVKEALSSDKLSADRRSDGYPEIHHLGLKAKDARLTFVNMDDPGHKSQRAMLEDAFEKEAVEKMRPMMQSTVDAVLEKMILQAGTSVDLIEEFATPVPTQIVYKVLGIPDEDIEKLSHDSEIRNSTSRNAAETSNSNLEEYMGRLVEKRIDKPQHDLVSKLVTEQYQKGNLEKDDITALAFLVLTAGNAALINSIGLGVMTLLQHPDQLKDLREKPALIKSAVQEILRFHTASALNCRRATKEDVTIGGQHIPKATGIICSVESADRDEDKFADPNEFNIHRDGDPGDILGFGYGAHRCQAEWFSRQELEIAIGTLFKRLPNLKLVEESETLEYSKPTMNIGITSLPVRW